MPKKGVIPPQFLKSPPPSWMGDKSKIRRDAKKDKVRASAKGRSKPKMAKTRGKSRKRAIHVVPDAVLAMAVAQPLVNGGNTGGDNALHYLLTNGGGDPATTLQGTMWRIEQNIVPAAKSAAVLGAVGFGIKWLAKKTGLSRIGTKEVKIA